jgi:DNA-binding NarL/FixJ family response regulator
MINQYVSKQFPYYVKDNHGLYVSMNQEFLDVSLIAHANDVVGYTDEAMPYYFRSTKSPLIGNKGRILGVQCVSFPVSDQCLIPLTKQQMACLKELALGFTQKQMAKNLGLSQKTVEHYLDAVKNKLQCKTRSELIMQAIERGLVAVF